MRSPVGITQPLPRSHNWNKAVCAAEACLPVGMPQPKRQTLSRGAAGLILATLTSCTTVNSEKVEVPMKSVTKSVHTLLTNYQKRHARFVNCSNPCQWRNVLASAELPMGEVHRGRARRCSRGESSRWCCGRGKSAKDPGARHAANPQQSQISALQAPPQTMKGSSETETSRTRGRTDSR